MMRSRLIIALLTLTALAGCVNDPCKEFAAPEDRLALCAVPVANPGIPTYCYRTLAGMQCYTSPQPGRELAVMGNAPS